MTKKKLIRRTKRIRGYVTHSLSNRILASLVGEQTATNITRYYWTFIPFAGLIIVSLLALLTSNTLASQSFIQQSGVAKVGDLNATTLEGVDAVVLAIPYLNQWINTDGLTGPNTIISNAAYPLGQITCGAASSAIISGYYSVIEYSNPQDLKDHVTQDKGQGLPNYCAQYGVTGGIFGVTGKGYCNQSSFGGIRDYFNLVGLSSKYISRNGIYEAINNQHPLIVSVSSPLGHIFVIKGYTEDGRVVVNDPFGDLNSVQSGYSYKGNNAIYDLDNPLFQINAIMEIYP